MQPRVRLALAWGGLALMVILAFALGRARRPAELDDRRASSFLAGPAGVRGLADALERLDVRVERWRGRIREFVKEPPRSERFALALLDPGSGLEATEVSALAEWHQSEAGADLILAGSGTDELMSCFGWAAGEFSFNPLPVRSPSGPEPENPAEISVFLEPEVPPATAEPAELICQPVPIASVDTILVAPNGQVAALRVHPADRRTTVLLLSDADLIRNRTLRETDTGPVVLSLFAEPYDVIVFEEGVHGFGTSGSLGRALLSWSRRSPWGWAAWQLALVGILALLAGAIRFGPVRSLIERRRRSPMEHVNALATALSAARGHDVAIAALIRGLRRRLAPTQPAASDPGPWLRELVERAPTAPAREQAGALLALSAPGQSESAVLLAANAVEDLWEEMHR
jgi:hypothetical protein